MDKLYRDLKKKLLNLENAFAYIVQEHNQKKIMLDEVWYDTADMKRVFHFSESKLARLRKANKIPYTYRFGRYQYPLSLINQILMESVYKNMQHPDKAFDDKEEE